MAGDGGVVGGNRGVVCKLADGSLAFVYLNKVAGERKLDLLAYQYDHHPHHLTAQVKMAIYPWASIQ